MPSNRVLGVRNRVTGASNLGRLLLCVRCTETLAQDGASGGARHPLSAHQDDISRICCEALFDNGVVLVSLSLDAIGALYALRA